MIKVIVIDDEPLALQQIAEMVSRTPFFELVAAGVVLMMAVGGG